MNEFEDKDIGENENDIDIFGFYKSNRPEKFSDSITVYKAELTEELFDYTLAKLSTNKKQSEFEKFIIHVASKLITPNIKPQTGPDGGGDGKVDGETYYVSEEISSKWFLPNKCEGEDKWAIAISCKKDWKTKVNHDVANIIQTGRTYSRILFFTNQLIKNSTRIEAEECLKNKYSIEVDIFDGTWCRKSVFVDGCKDIAIKELNLSDLYGCKETIEGPLDRNRKKRLKEIEEYLNSFTPKGLDTSYIELLIEVNLLSRSLELPKYQIESRFSFSLSECEKHGTTQQKFRIIYDHGWTAFYWFRDPETCYSDYQKLKCLIKEECNVKRIEFLTTLLTNIGHATRLGYLEEDIYVKEINYLNDLNNSLQDNHEKYSCCIFLGLYFIENVIITKVNKNEDITDELIQLKELLCQSLDRGDISFEIQYKIIDSFGIIIKSNPIYEELVDFLAEELSKREAQISGARVHYKRGIQHFNNDDYKNTIRQLGFCVYAFEKEECIEELTDACFYMGLSLFSEELYYSSEAYLVKASSLLIKEFYALGTINNKLILCLTRLCDIELFLGRLVMFLNYYELLQVLSNNSQFNETKEFAQTMALWDISWSCRFADANMDSKSIERVPDVLERNGLEISASIVKYLLGYENEIDPRMKISGTDIKDKLLKQPVVEQFVTELNIMQAGDVKISSTVKNCTFNIKYPNSAETQVIAETFLACIESLLSTLNDKDIHVLTKNIDIEVIYKNEDSIFRKTDNPEIYNLILSNDRFTDIDLWRCFSGFMAHYFTYNVLLKDEISKLIDNLQDKEKIMDRVMVLMTNKLSIENVLGKQFRFCIEQWNKDSDKFYRNISKRKHISDIKYVSHKQKTVNHYSVNINNTAWDRAKWKGIVSFFCGINKPIILGLAFQNIEYGKMIFEEWKKNHELQVTIYFILGISKLHPYWYRVCVAPTINHPEDGLNISTMCRMHTMEADNDKNINIIRNAYNTFKTCNLMPIEMFPDYSINKKIDPTQSIPFKNIVIKEAWEISTDDISMIALLPWDEPFIPKEMENDAPVLKVLKQLKDCKKQV